MIRASDQDRALVVSILTSAFKENKSVNYLIKQTRKERRLAYLMAYSFDLCLRFGEVFLNDDKTAVALVLYPDRKRVTLQTLLLDIKLVFRAIGVRNMVKALKRETKIKAGYPSKAIYYLWFIGVDSTEQRKGKGSKMLSFVVKEAKKQGKPIYLETSTVKNIAWYEQQRFRIFKTLDFGYPLYMLHLKWKS